jgi:hypothetical protein
VSGNFRSGSRSQSEAKNLASLLYVSVCAFGEFWVSAADGPPLDHVVSSNLGKRDAKTWSGREGLGFSLGPVCWGEW